MKVVFLSIMLAVAGVVVPVSAQAVTQSYQLDIPRQSLDGALNDFARQTGLQIARFTDIPTDNAWVGPVSGKISIDEALRSLLAPNRLTYKMVNEHTISVMALGSTSAQSSSEAGDVQQEGQGRKSSSAAAPAGAPSTSAAAKAEQNQDVLEDIVVTAQRREERLQSVPIAVTAITADSIAERHMESASDLQLVVPSLMYNVADENGTPYIRGIGNSLAFPNADSDVATYVDGAYVAEVAGIDMALLGVERIEVLEGPQGTLFGRNAVGGAINITTLTPTDQSEVALSASGGSFRDEQVTGHISGPVTDNLFVGIYGGYQTQAPYTTQLITPTESVISPDTVKYGIRLKAVYEAADWLKFTGSVELTQKSGYQDDAFRQIQPNAIEFNLFSAPKIIEPYVSMATNDNFETIRSTATTFRGDVDLGWSRIVTITNARELKQNVHITDVTGTFIPLFVEATPSTSSTQYSQEVQLQSSPNSKVDWIGGLYYYQEIPFENDQNTTSSVSSLLQPAAQQVGVYMKSTSAAVYGQVGIPLDFITDGLKLTLGGRYTHDHKWLTQSYLAPYLPGSVAACGGLWLLQPTCGKLSGPVQYYPLGDGKIWNNFSPKATLSYQLPDTLLYFTFAKGYKAGAYNLAAAGANVPANPETVTSYEVGSKSDFLGSRLRWNNAAYYYNFDNIQVITFALGSGSTETLQNAANAKAYGLESSLEAVVTTGLRANAGLSLEHTEYTSFPNFAGVNVNAPCTAGTGADCNPALVIDATGNRLPQAPAFVLTAGLNYDHHLANDGSVFSHINFYHNGGFYWSAQNSEFGGYRQAAYSLVNATVGYTSPKQWTVSAWVTNLFNKFYETDIDAIASIGTIAQDAPPRMYGVTLSVKL
jgi:iron complex outermembrane recepter protein